MSEKWRTIVWIAVSWSLVAGVVFGVYVGTQPYRDYYDKHRYDFDKACAAQGGFVVHNRRDDDWCMKDGKLILSGESGQIG